MPKALDRTAAHHQDIARVTAVCRGRHHQQHTLKEQP